MNLTFRREGNVLFVDVAGRVDSGTVTEFDKGVREAIAETDRGLVMDFRELVFISTVGLRVLLLMAKFLVNRNGRLALCNLSDPVRASFEISGFAKIIPIHPTRDAAVAALQAELTRK